MPSKAYKTFQANLEHVKRIRDVHRTLDAHKGFPDESKRGRRKLNHINRSALIILCASWEQYIEDVTLNSGDVVLLSTDVLVKSMSGARDLPASVRKNIGGSIANLKNDLAALESAVANWKRTYKKSIEQAVRKFHSPTCENIHILLSQNIGVTYKVFSQSESSADGNRLDAIIRTRNTIVHRGVQHGKYTTLQTVNESIGVISRLAAKTDNYLKLQLTKTHPEKTPPWDGKAT